MSTIKRFEDLIIWQLGRNINQEVHHLTKSGSFGKDYALIDQINRSAGSIMDNIAEGYERDNNKEFIVFLGYAKGSSGEVRSQLHRAFDRDYIDTKTIERLLSTIVDLSKAIRGLINYLKASEIKGHKFKEDPEFYQIAKDKNLPQNDGKI